MAMASSSRNSFDDLCSLFPALGLEANGRARAEHLQTIEDQFPAFKTQEGQWL
jgi:hypothetical protein